MIGHEKNNLEKIRNFLSKELSEIQSIHQGQDRSKRSLIPIVGKALSFLFGTVSDSDLSAIKHNIRSLAKSQETIRHVLNSSLTVLKNVQGQSINNTRTINAVIDVIERLEETNKNLTSNLNDTNKQVNTYTMLDRAVNEVQNLIEMARDHAQTIQLQLDMLSLGHLSPAVISPSNLRRLLLEVRGQLDRNFQFPFDPDTDLWTFYRTLTCTTLVHSDQLVVVLSIPLLDTLGAFDVYKVYNIPLPRNVPNNNLQARYDLEAPALLIDKRRSQFSLLSSSELPGCMSSIRPYCAIRNPVYSILSSSMCIVHLFLGHTDKVKKFCEILVTPNAPTPQARYLSDGHWVITSAAPLTFSVGCNASSSTNQVIKVSPPLDIIRLPLACSAFNGRMTLPPFFHKESKYNLSSLFRQFLQNYKFGLINVWKSFDISLPSFGNIGIPKKLKTVKEMPLDNLIFELKNSIPDIEPMPADIPIYYYLLGALGIIILVLFCCFRRRLRNCFSKFKICSWSVEKGTVEEPPCPTITRPDQPDVRPSAPSWQESDQAPRSNLPEPESVADVVRQQYHSLIDDQRPWSYMDNTRHTNWEPPVVSRFSDGHYVYRLDPHGRYKIRKLNKKQNKKRNSYPGAGNEEPAIQVQNYPGVRDNIQMQDYPKLEPVENAKQIEPTQINVTSGRPECDDPVRPDVQTSPPQVEAIPLRTMSKPIPSIYPGLSNELKEL